VPAGVGASWRTATWHMCVMVTAVVLFALAAWRQHPGYRHGNVTSSGLALSIAGLVVAVLGGWLGGKVVFVHGYRVVGEVAEPGARQGVRR
jgi:uncharacterized membrane protein